MSVDRVKFQDILEDQLPRYVREDFPLLTDFLKQYYLSQEVQGGTFDLVQNIDKYVKLDEIFNISSETELFTDVDYDDTTINTSVNGNFTVGFPDNNGLIQIDDEIIYYATKTDKTFEGCIRGFSGITTYISSQNPEELTFEKTEADFHEKGAQVKNLSVIFLQEFFKKIKKQFAPGFTERSFDSNVDQRNFIFGSNSFYQSKGTDQSFKILFKSLYGEEVNVIKPEQFLFKLSDADYRVTKDLVVESLEGNPLNLLGKTLFQTDTESKGSVTKVEKINSDEGDFYRLGIDIGYDRDIDVRGTIYSQFGTNSKTKILNSVAIGQTFIDVDSTLGFGQTGYLTTKDIDGDNLLLNYTSKSINQFYGVEGVTYTINEGEDLRDTGYAYGYELDGSVIKVRVGSTLNRFIMKDETYSCSVDDVISVKSIGIESKGERSKSWFTNLKTTLDVSVIGEIDVSERIYEIDTFDDHFLYPGYSIILYNNSGSTVNGKLTRISGKRSFTVRLESEIVIGGIGVEWKVVNQILKTQTEIYPKLSENMTNILNTYSKFDGESLVVSNSLPSYSDNSINPYDKEIKFSGSSIDTYTLKLTTNSDRLSFDHGFRTGDAIYYSRGVVDSITTTPDGVEFVTQQYSGFENLDSLVYYVKRVDQEKIKLARSKSDIFVDKYIPLLGEVSNITISYYPNYDKKLLPQPIVREILSPDPEVGDFKTEPGFYNGIFLNGVELVNYKSTDKIFYGQVESINIGNPGEGFDVINPPLVHIEDTDVVGSGATGFVAVEGQLDKIQIIDPGFDYLTTPVINISGGSGKDASAEVNMTTINHSVSFNAGVSTSNIGGINTTTNTIGFSTYHKFRDNEQVIYNSNSLLAPVGLVTGSTYFTKVIDQYSIQLHNTFDDSILGINTVGFGITGYGNQSIDSYNRKKVISSIVVTNPGSGYKNKRRQIPEFVGVKTASDQIFITNHGYETGEIVNYYSSGNDIQGISTTSDYYVTKVDNNNFKLSLVGLGVTQRNFDFDNQVYVDLNSVGTGHFNYKPIVISVSGVTGVSTLSDQDFGAKVQPIFRGSIDSVDITEGGVGYGSSEILNFSRDPVVTFKSGENAKLQPIISNGRIVDVIVISEGSQYVSIPNLIVEGSGNYAKLIPIIDDGRLKSVNIESGGIGYVPVETTISVESAGKNVISGAILNQWNVNLVARDQSITGFDDGFVTQSNDNKSLQYSSAYTPRSLRESVNALNGDGSRFFGANDLRIELGVEVDNIRHSPIIGWAYDGAPIYGPYGFANAKKGLVKQMESGYELNINNPNRPTKSVYPGGFFVEDYVFTNKGDLDEHNGRYCVTPDYPSGVYAYFTTVTSIPDSSGVFKNFKSPVFPYCVGPTFKFKPNNFNFLISSNQTDYDIESNGWFRNTDEYHLNDDRSGYQFIFNSNGEDKQGLRVTSTSRGTIESVGILTGGKDYSVDDRVVFNNVSTGGQFAQSKVERVDGGYVNNVDTVSNVVNNVEFVNYNGQTQFIGFSTVVHDFQARDLVQVDGLSDYFRGFDGTYRVGVRSDSLVLTLGTPASGITGITTYFYVSGSLQYPNVRPNDILSINGEKVKVINLDKITGRIRVIREQDGTTGIAHTNTSVLRENPKKFTINTPGISSTRRLQANTELYFISNESVGIGTTTGLGVGTTVSINDPGVGATQRFIEPRSIFIPDHNLKVNDKLFYNKYGNTSIQVWNGDPIKGYQSLDTFESFYAAPLTSDTIGISTNKVGIGTSGEYIGINTDRNLLYFTATGNGDYHSFETNFDDVIRATVSKNTTTVSTAKTHNIKTEDVVYLSVKPYDIETVTVKYDDNNRRMVFNPLSFVSGDVNTIKDTIKFPSHTFKKGDKVIYTSDSPVGGLNVNEMYFVIPYDTNNIQLVNNKYEVSLLSPTFVNLTSVGSGSLSRINPLVNIKRNQKLKFDLSDSSLSFVSNGENYSGFEMSLYSDINYINQFETSSETNEFEVTKFGEPGFANANLTLFVSDYIPQSLWYNFEPQNLDILKDSKREYMVDEESPSHNQINVVSTKYDGRHVVSGIGSTTFSFNIGQIPDKLSYDGNDSTITFETSSKTQKGPITRLNIVNPGYGYESLPGVDGVVSDEGYDAILYSQSNNIGKILNTEYISNNIGYDYPTDKTLKVVSNIPQIVEVETLASFDYIGISSNGRNYLIAPDLVVLDGYTNEVIPEIDIKYTLGDNQVTIFTNTYGLHDAPPRIVPTNNSNGVGIKSITYDNTTKTAQAFLSQSFSSLSNFPFKVNDTVFIENTSVGVGSTGSGYNSSDYSYTYFKIVSTDPNIGGSNGSITYDMSDVVATGTVPGRYDISGSLGKAIPISSLPIFDPVISKNNFFVGEKVVSQSATGFVESWNPVNEIARIASSDEFKPGDKIVAQTSGTISFIGGVTGFDSEIITGSGTTIINGWQRNTGFLNDNLQVTSNNEYYQNFSYSISSPVPLDKWDDSVSSIVHPSGFQKFSDLQVESYVRDLRSNNSGESSQIDVTVDIQSESSIHCFFDFDGVSERTSLISGEPVSREIFFENRILTDHFESISNLVTTVDDFSSKFNSNTREDIYIDIANFDLSQVFNRVFTYVKDQTFTQERVFNILGLLQDGSVGYINEYATLATAQQLGQFDYVKKQTGWQFRFFPTSPQFNNYDVTVVTNGLFSSNQGFGTDRYNLSDVAEYKGTQVDIPTGTKTDVVSFATTHRSSSTRIIMDLGDNNFFAYQVNIIHDGTDVSITNYGDMTTNQRIDYGTQGIGTFGAEIDGSFVNLNFTPIAGVAATATSFNVLTSANETGVSSTKMRTSRLISNYVSIAASTSPVEQVISTYADPFQSAYYLVTIDDDTNNQHQFSEVVTINTDFEEFFTSFGEVYTGDSFTGLGTFGIITDSSNTMLTFTPKANIDVEVRVIGQELQIWDGNNDLRDINTDFGDITNNEATFRGTNLEQTNRFSMNTDGKGIFVRSFDGDNPDVVGVGTNSVKIPNHLFESGQNITYSGNQGRDNDTTVNNISIASTVVPGIGLTDKLPVDLYAVKINDGQLAFSDTAENALLRIPKTFQITGVGVGTFHQIKSKNQDARTLVLIDNMIQSPVAETDITTSLTETLSTETLFTVAGITSFFSDDIIKIDDEYMTLISAYQDPDDSLYYMKVVRGLLESSLEVHTNSSTLTKISGNYHIVENNINFVQSPKGLTPLSTSIDGPDGIDWTGITTHSSFQGRVFNRTSFVGSSTDNYINNVVFDDISVGFSGISSEFVLKSGGVDQTGISTDNIIMTINGVFQEPDGVQRDGVSEFPAYDLIESGGQTIVQFRADPYREDGDNNTRSYPRGGILMEIGSSEGTGYQPLVAAGGTAVVSTTGTITSISIGSSGSGYRSGIQETVNVGVQTYSDGIPSIQFIGTAAISGGHIVSVAVTNPGTGYTTTNPPEVVIDEPLAYKNIPLIYAPGYSGIGTGASVDIVVGNGSSVIEFNLNEKGTAYGNNIKLTVGVGGTVGIPTYSSHTNFEIDVIRTQRDHFQGHYIGELEVFDRIDDKFDGTSKTFNLSIGGELYAIVSRKGSRVDTKKTLLVFVNNVLQEPGRSYNMGGGSLIRFNEAPKPGDTCTIYFYKGTRDKDVIFRDIFETVKEGDTLNINNNSNIGQSFGLSQNDRIVVGVNTIDSVATTPYVNPGVTTDTTILRPISWCKQLTDVIIDGEYIGKDRFHYEPNIFPFSYLINSIGVTTTVVYVDSLKPLFDSLNETEDTEYQGEILIVSQNEKITGVATAIVNDFGEISGINLSNPGAGYTANPQISIANPEDGTRSFVESLTQNQKIVGFNIVQSGTGYTSTNPPIVLIEPPPYAIERVDVVDYSGDYGIIVGFGTLTDGDKTQFVFDFFIPYDSFMRNDDLTSDSTVTSGIQTGDFFVVFDSFETALRGTVVSLETDNSTRLGVTTEFLDNVYQVDHAQTVSVNVIGAGVTDVRRVYTNIVGFTSDGVSFDGTNNTFDSTVYTMDRVNYEVFSGGIGTSFNYGQYSWGKMNLKDRRDAQQFSSYGGNGYSGLSTSAYIRRENQLKFKGYDIIDY